MAPELFEVSLDSGYNELESPYQGEPVDVFAVGVLIFNMVAGFCASNCADFVKDNYIHLKKGNPKRFWRKQEEYNKIIEGPPFTDLFKELI
jgi:hypothetical protein